MIENKILCRTLTEKKPLKLIFVDNLVLARHILGIFFKF